MARIRFSQLMPLIAVVSFASFASFAGAEAPEDAYLKADMLISKAKSQESSRFYKSASDTIKKAESALVELQKANPDWHPDWIERKMGGVREMTERLVPLVEEFPDSVDQGNAANTRDYSVAPSATKKTSAIEEALKPSISISSGVAAPVEVLAGSSHERYLKNDPTYLAHVQEQRAEAARRQQEAIERQRALKAEERSRQSELNALLKRQQQEEEALKKLEKLEKTVSRPAAQPIAPLPSPTPAVIHQAAESDRGSSEALANQREEANRQAQLLKKEQEAQIRAQKAKVEEARRNLEKEQSRIRSEQARIQKEHAEAVRKQQEAKAAEEEAERARIQAEEEARKKRVTPRSAPRESSGRSRFRIG